MDVSPDAGLIGRRHLSLTKTVSLPGSGIEFAIFGSRVGRRNHSAIQAASSKVIIQSTVHSLGNLRQAWSQKAVTW